MRYFLILLLSIVVFNVKAGDDDQARELKARGFIVQMLSEEPKILALLQKDKDPNKLTTYRKNIRESNDLIKKAVTRFWKHHKTVLYKTKAEIEAMKAAEEEKKKKLRKHYAVMSMDFFSGRVKTREESAVLTDQQYTGDGNYLFIRFWEGIQFVYTSIPHVIPTEADLVYAVRYLSNQIEGMEYGKDITKLCEENAPQMRSKTLLLTAWQASQLEAKDWEKYYPYPHKIVSQTEIDKAIVNADPNFAVIVYSDQSDTVVLKTMVLTGTGQFAGYITDIKRNPITKKELKELVKYSQ